MNTEKKMGFATRQIHVGKEPDQYGALVPPIYMTSTFESVTPQYAYSRISNPSLTVVEKKMASLEGGEAALATASGMGAISATLWTILKAGDEIVADDTLYGCTHTLLTKGLSKFSIFAEMLLLTVNRNKVFCVYKFLKDFKFLLTGVS